MVTELTITGIATARKLTAKFIVTRLAFAFSMLADHIVGAISTAVSVAMSQ